MKDKTYLVKVDTKPWCAGHAIGTANQFKQKKQNSKNERKKKTAGGSGGSNRWPRGN